MHVRTEAWYDEMFIGCRFMVKMNKAFSYGPKVYPNVIFCLVPYPENPVSALVASGKLA